MSKNIAAPGSAKTVEGAVVGVTPRGTSNRTRLAAQRAQAVAKLLRVKTLLPRLAESAQGFATIKLLETELRSAVNGVAPVNMEVFNWVSKGLHSDSMTHRRNALALLISIIGDQDSAMKADDRKRFLRLGEYAAEVFAKMAVESQRDAGNMEAAMQMKGKSGLA